MSRAVLGARGHATRVLVLDVECAVSRTSVALLPNGGAAGVDRHVLQELTAAAMLSFSLTDRGLADLELVGTLAGDDERGVLIGVDRALAVLGADGVLVTHNGLAHDIPLLLRRCLANWTFECGAIREWSAVDEARHVDTLRRFGRGGRSAGLALTDLCASLGIEAAVPPPSRRFPVDASLRKGAVDVVRTALVYLHLEAMERGDGCWLAACWGDLATYLLSDPVRADHLLPLARQGLRIAEAAGRLA